jgi:AcrR family transcriptional regulator
MTKHMSEAERRAQIIAAAREEFNERGYADSRVEDVARRAGLSKGAVYFYFPSKDDLFMALVLEEHEKTYSFLDDSERDERPALARLVDVGWKYTDYLSGLDAPPRFFLMMTEAAMRDEEIRAECQAIHHRFVDAVTRILAQGMSEGAFRAMDPHAVAQMLKAMIDGFAGQAAIGVPPDRGRLTSEGFRMILRGVLTEPDLADRFLGAPPSPFTTPPMDSPE